MNADDQEKLERIITQHLARDPWRSNVDEKIGILSKSQSELHVGQQAIIAAIKQNTVITEDVAEIVNLAKSFFRFWGWVGRKGSMIAKPIGIIAAAATAVWVVVYQLLHNGNLPK